MTGSTAYQLTLECSLFQAFQNNVKRSSVERINKYHFHVTSISLQIQPIRPQFFNGNNCPHINKHVLLTVLCHVFFVVLVGII